MFVLTLLVVFCFVVFSPASYIFVQLFILSFPYHAVVGTYLINLHNLNLQSDSISESLLMGEV